MLATRQTAASLIDDPLALGRLGTVDAVIKAVLTHSMVRNNMPAFERLMLGQEQAPCPVVHRFGPGVYIREITLPSGCFAVGAKHKVEHQNVMLKGRVTVLNDDGTTTELVAPMMFVGKPGQKVGYIHEEVVWQNIFATDETDIETLEAMFVDKGEAWGDVARARRASIQDEIDRSDYWRVLSEWGIPHKLARAQSLNTADLVQFPHGGYKVMVTDSTIEGRGLFATAPIEPGERIAPARIGQGRTPAGRYTNHSACPNAKFVLLPNGDLDLVATQPIEGMQGGMPGQEITIDYRQALGIRRNQCRQQLQHQ